MTGETGRDTWERGLAELLEEANTEGLRVWRGFIKFESLEDNSLILSVPYTNLLEFMELHYRKRIENKITSLTGKPVSLTIELRQKKQDPPARKKPAPPRLHPDMNPKYTFDRFIVGDSNKFAHAACTRVAESPGRFDKYNPLILYSVPGLGKTHLMQAVGHKLYSTNPHIKVRYVSTHGFVGEFVESVKNKTDSAFREKYSRVQVLLMDDIQFLAGKEGTQIQLFNIFNQMMDSSRQMIFSSDRPVTELKQLDDRLKNRFEKGPALDIQPPIYETRVAILRRMASEQTHIIDDEIIEFLAKNINKDIRKLEGAFHKVLTYMDFTDSPLGMADIRKIVKDFITDARHGLIPSDIQKLVSEYFNVSYSDLKSGKKTRGIVFPRQIAMFLSRKMTRLTFQEIAQEFGGKNHATILHACKKIEKLKAEDTEVSNALQSIMSTINEQ